MKTTYPYVLPLFVTGFESSLDLFLFGTTLGVPVLYFRMPCAWGFPCIMSLVYHGCWRNNSQIFLLLFASSCLFDTPYFFPCTTVFGCCWVSLLADGQSLSSVLLSAGVASAPPSCEVGCPRAASFCFLLVLLEGVFASRWISAVASRISCCSCFCFVSLEVAAPHLLPVQTGSLHGRYVYYGICHI